MYVVPLLPNHPHVTQSPIQVSDHGKMRLVMAWQVPVKHSTKEQIVNLRYCSGTYRPHHTAPLLAIIQELIHYAVSFRICG